MLACASNDYKSAGFTRQDTITLEG